MTAAPPPVIPRVDLALAQGRMLAAWRPGLSPHQFILGQNGAGKTGLITRGIMPACKYDRVLTIDVKGGDPMWEGYGRPIERVTPGFHGDGEGPGRNWYRLVVDPINAKADAKRLVAEALDLALDEGHMILVIDEARTVTDREELNLSAKLEAALLRGRSRGLLGIVAAQATEYTVPSVRNQWAILWLGALKDDEVIRRALKIAGLPPAYLGPVRELARREWLYLDAEDGQRITGLART